MTEPDADDALDAYMTLLDVHVPMAARFAHDYRQVPIVAAGHAVWKARVEAFRQRVAHPQVPHVDPEAELAASSAVMVHRPRDAAARLKMSTSALRKARREGRISGQRLSRGWGFTGKEVERFMSERRRSA